MKLLFLDVDGVIINRQSCKVSYDNPDLNCVTRLNQLIEQSGAKIVVTGAWRMNRTVKELQQLLGEWGVRGGAMIAKTPYGPRSCNRGDEIGRFFQEWRGEEIESFAILDQHADFGRFLPHLVHTRFESGLTINDAEMATKILGKPKQTTAQPTPSGITCKPNAHR